MLKNRESIIVKDHICCHSVKALAVGGAKVNRVELKQYMLYKPFSVFLICKLFVLFGTWKLTLSYFLIVLSRICISLSCDRTGKNNPR